MQQFAHTTVLLHETVDAVLPHSGGRYIDCTLGGAGHSEQLLQRSAPAGQLVAFDQDETAIEHARTRLARFKERVQLVNTNFRDMEAAAKQLGFAPVDGIIFDLGVSSPQFDDAERGFSYRNDAALDMRMDTRIAKTAADVVNTYSEEALARIFYEYGEEKFSRQIARAIARERAVQAIETTERLADVVKSAIPAAARRTGPHPARRVFQALRIEVNDELGALREGLEGAFRLLKPGGRIAAITFHSLEDRIVKHAFAEWSKGCECPPDFPVCVCGKTPNARVVTRKPVYPSTEEIEANPRARSAKLRIVEKL